MSKNVKLFVYGTLRPGQPLHYVLAPHILDMESDYIKGDLYLAKVGWYPVASDGDGTILGVTVTIPEPILAVLDKIECTPDLFQRFLMRTGQGNTVYAYFGNNVELGEKIIGGDFEEHRKEKGDA